MSPLKNTFSIKADLSPISKGGLSTIAAHFDDQSMPDVADALRHAENVISGLNLA